MYRRLLQANTILLVAILLIAGCFVSGAMATTMGPLLGKLMQEHEALKNGEPCLGLVYDNLIAVQSEKKFGTKRVGLIMYLENGLPDFSTIPSLEIGSVTKNIATARIDVTDLQTLKAISGLSHIRASRLFQPTMDLAVGFANVDQVWSGTPAFTGAGVLVGVIDTGIDFYHDDFRNSDGSTRIKAIWDLYATGGTPPAGFVGGVEYTEARINLALNGSSNIAHQDLRGHGTHVSGIAAGNGRTSGGQYRGVAFNSDILFAKPYTSGGFPEDKTIEAMNYLAQKALLLDQPIVINMSLGGHDGPHDGSSAQEQVVDDLSGEGVVFCIAAGNDGENYIHDSGSAAGTNLMLHIPAYNTGGGLNNDQVTLNLWVDGSSSPIVTVSDTYFSVDPVSSGSTGGGSTLSGAIYIDNASSGVDPISGDKQIIVQLNDSAGSEISSGDWTINISGGSGTVHAWIMSKTMPAVFPNSDNSHSVATPSLAAEAISVGASKTRQSWDAQFGTFGYAGAWGDIAEGDLAPFSARGPARDGGEKPDVVAPGMAIVSCYSSLQNPAAQASSLMPGAEYLVSQGTSMASPLVAGIVGQMLEKNPTLTAAEVRTILRNTAAHDTFTGTGWSTGFGAGKVDAFAALAAVAGAEPAATGDINGDHRLTVVDVILLVNHIIDPVQNPLSTEQRTEADVFPSGGDGNLNISDITRIVAFIVETDAPGNQTMPEVVFEAATIVAGDISEHAGYNVVPVTLSGQAVGATQFVVTLPGAIWQTGAVEISGVTAANIRARVVGHQLRVLIYGLKDNLPSNGLRFTLPFTSEENITQAPKLSSVLVSDRLGFPREVFINSNVGVMPAVQYLNISPNPTPADAEISFALGKSQNVMLAVYDIRGRLVRQLAIGPYGQGSHSASWNGHDATGKPAAAGTYLLRLSTPGHSVTKKILLTK